MDNLFTAVILGIIEGLTEFLPVSSTGHLILAGHALHFTGTQAETFEIIIQLGAILAVVVLYFERFYGLLPQYLQKKIAKTRLGKKALAKLTENGIPTQNGTILSPFSSLRGLFLLFLTCLPASLLGLLAHNAIKENLFNPFAVAISLAAGSLYIIFAELYAKRRAEKMQKEQESSKNSEQSGIRYATLDDITPLLALGIGFFQCLALWPGFSRSAATIMGAMLLGSGRKLAAEYSFIAAVPIMVAATGFDLISNSNAFALNDIPFILTGFVVSFLSAWLAVRLFIHFVSKTTFLPFAWYRLMLVPCIFLFW